MRYLVDSNRVSYERLQEEVIIINVATGSYFSGSGTAADLWTLIAAGASLEEIASILAAAYKTEAARIRSDVESCIARLTETAVISGTAPANGKADQQLLDHIRFTTKLISASEYTNSIPRAAEEARIRKIQAGLAALGYRPGRFDGHVGAQTSEAIRQFEADRGWPVTGEISEQLIAELTDIGAFAEGEAR